MGLESTVSGVLSLNEAWPIHDVDPASASYAHIQNIKKGLIGSFPNVQAQASPSSAELNHLRGLTAHPQTQLDTLSASAVAMAATIEARRQTMSLSAQARIDLMSNGLSTSVSDLSATLNAREQTMSAVVQVDLEAMSAAASLSIDSLSAAIDSQISTMQSTTTTDRQTMSANSSDQIHAFSATMDARIEALSATLNAGLLDLSATAAAMLDWGDVNKFIQTATPTAAVGDIWFEI